MPMMLPRLVDACRCKDRLQLVARAVEPRVRFHAPRWPCSHHSCGPGATRFSVRCCGLLCDHKRSLRWLEHLRRQPTHPASILLCVCDATHLRARRAHYNVPSNVCDWLRKIEYVCLCVRLSDLQAAASAEPSCFRYLEVLNSHASSASVSVCRHLACFWGRPFEIIATSPVLERAL